jgi:hypothetical protein
MKKLKHEDSILLFTSKSLGLVIFCIIGLHIIFIAAMIRDNQASGIESLFYFAKSILKTLIFSPLYLLAIYVFSLKILIGRKKIEIIRLFGLIKKKYKWNELIEIKEEMNKKYQNRLQTIHLIFNDSNKVSIGRDYNNFNEAIAFLRAMRDENKNSEVLD